MAELPKISFQVSDKKKKEIEKFAEDRGLTTASLCRFVILEQLKKQEVKNANE